MVKIDFEPYNQLMEPGTDITRALLKENIARDFKLKHMTGTPEALLRIDFSPTDGSDILVQKIDPEKALGYSVFSSEEDYFQKLGQSLYEPSEEDITGGNL